MTVYRFFATLLVVATLAALFVPTWTNEALIITIQGVFFDVVGR